MIRWPGKVKPRFCADLAITVDLAPTILAACGLEPTPAMAGINLLDEKAVKERKAIFGETFTHNAVDIHDPAANLEYRWVIEGEWKLLLPNRANVPRGKVELYHITRDPHEKEDLASKYPDKVKHLTQLVDNWWPAK
jgi:arylsulfatase A-like enzyme